MDTEPAPTTPQPPSEPPSDTSGDSPPSPKPRKKLWLPLAGIIVLAIAFSLGWLLHGHGQKPAETTAHNTVTDTRSAKSDTATSQGLQLDTTKNYGDKYADGLLPVGDGKYVTDAPKQGYVYACGGYANNLQTDNGGAMVRGPWFTNNNTEYNANQKLRVSGNVMWQADFSNTVNGGTRTIITNDLPSHPTGIFPIMASDPAYQYDRNPNSIKGQTLTFALAADPTYSSTPSCMGGTVGIMLTGVELNSAFDAGGRDAGAWEIQDGCDGHPQQEGVYHYHTLSSCIKDVSVHTVIGYALDGFPITGPDITQGNVLTTSDLDECHGITGQISLDGKSVTAYHYVMTQDFPYSISCYRGTPIQPPGMQPPGPASRR